MSIRSTFPEKRYKYKKWHEVHGETRYFIYLNINAIIKDVIVNNAAGHWYSTTLTNQEVIPTTNGQFSLRLPPVLRAVLN